MTIKYKSIKEIRNMISHKEISNKEVVQEVFSLINEFKDLNAFITLNEENSIKKAEEFDNNPSDLPLAGIPIAQKDLFCTEGLRTTCGSNILNNFIPPYSATVIKNLENAGCISVGKTNMDEFAMGSSNEASFFGNVKNPWGKDLVPGGSSGGAASAVAAGLVPAATGTDTGGSIRQPASLCGITGIKPTYGRVSRWGMIAFASSLDQAGIISKNAKDAAIALKYMSGFDQKDSTSLNEEVKDFEKEVDADQEHVIGIPKELIEKIKNDQVRDSFENAISVLEKEGAKIEEINLPHIDYSLPAYYVIAPAECSANLARYDGIRFGHRSKSVSSLEDLYVNSRTEGFGREVKNRIFIGTFCLSAGYYDAFYNKALKIRNLIKSDFDEAFKKVSSIAMPTCSNSSFELGSINDPVEMYEQDIYTIPANLAGLPALSIPSGTADEMPIGLQLIGNYLEEGKILNLANKFQKLTDFHEFK